MRVKYYYAYNWHMENETRKAVNDSPLSQEAIAFGSGVGLSWLQKFMQNNQQDYGIRRIAKVAEFLNKQKKQKAKK